MLQSTEKLAFWPTWALLRPDPLHSTLLASELPGLGAALWVRLLLDALTVESRVRVEVSLALVTATSREPMKKEDRKLSKGQGEG